MLSNLLRAALIVALVVIGFGPASTQAQEPVVINVQTTYGDCSAEYEGVTDPAQAGGDECGVMRVIMNKFEAENPDIKINNIIAEWPGTTTLNTAIAAGTPPDLVVLNAQYMYDYASRGLLMPLTDGLAAAGVSLDDYMPAVVDYVTLDNRLFALPFSLYGAMWHLNLDIWKQAGLLDPDGNPILPTTAEEYLADAQKVKDTTGLPFSDLQTNGLNGTTWAFNSLVFQQGADIVDAEGKPQVNTPEGLTALQFLDSLLTNGYATPLLDYGGAQEVFLSGQDAGWWTGNWAVGYYVEQVADPESALKNYMVVPFPQLYGTRAAWAGYNLWLSPLGINANIAPERADAIYRLLAFFHEHQGDWARTGNIPVRQSVLESEGFKTVNGFDAFTEFAEIARPYPRVTWAPAYERVMNEEIQAVYVDTKTPEQALADAQARLEEFLSFMQ